MAETTKIEWCDSSLNIMAGCDGCELWNRKTGVKHCYAGTMTDVYGGRPGWPETFEQPKLFTERLDKALRWPDLTSKERPDKPWLNGRPRMIFLNDMGDTFTESLPLDWLAPLLPRLADSPHVWMILTKRGRRMREFSARHPFPPNVWPGVSVTTEQTLTRMDALENVKGGGWKWVSAEPLLEEIDMSDRLLYEERDIIEGGTGPVLGMTRPFGLVIVGGESGPGARPSHPDWFRGLRDQCQAAGVAFFHKQNGEWLRLNDEARNTIGDDDPRISDSQRRQGGHKAPLALIGRDMFVRVGKKDAGRLLDGRTWDEFPA